MLKNLSNQVNFYPSNDEAANDIDSILWDFDHALIKQEFNPDWLLEYSQLRHYGVITHQQGTNFLPQAKLVSGWLKKKSRESIIGNMCVKNRLR